jgi:hypothetical protein
MFFDSANNPRIVPNSRGKKRVPGAKDLHTALRTTDKNFVEFLEQCLCWNPERRITPREAFEKPFIRDGGKR